MRCQRGSPSRSEGAQRWLVGRVCQGAEQGVEHLQEQDASWGEGEREDGEEERGGGGDGCWEGGREGVRSRTGV